MDERSAIETSELSPYRRFSRSEWAALRADTPLTLTIEDLAKLQSINDPISVEEVIAIYLPLSRDGEKVDYIFGASIFQSVFGTARS